MNTSVGGEMEQEVSLGEEKTILVLPVEKQRYVFCHHSLDDRIHYIPV